MSDASLANPDCRDRFTCPACIKDFYRDVAIDQREDHRCECGTELVIRVTMETRPVATATIKAVSEQGDA